MPDILSIIIAILVTVAIIYFLIFKPSEETTKSNTSLIQSSIDAVRKTLTMQGADTVDIKDNLIPELQKKINQSIVDLSSTVSTKSSELSKSISDLKTANDALSQSTTLSVDKINELLSTLKSNFDAFATSQGDIITKLTDAQKADIVNVYTAIDKGISQLWEAQGMSVKNAAAVDKGMSALGVTITTLQTSIQKSIDTLTGVVTTKNAEFTTLVSNLQKADTILSKSTTDIQTKLDNLQKAFDTFVKTQAEELKRIDKRINSLTQTGIDDKAALTFMIKDLITQEHVEMVEKKFPEIKSTIDQMKSDNQIALKNLQRQLNDNATNDIKYNNYVDTINKYIDNAVVNPEISVKVKKRIFNASVKDYFMEYRKLTTNKERDAYWSKIYENVTGCTSIGDLEQKQHGDLKKLGAMLLNSQKSDEVIELIFLANLTDSILLPEDNKPYEPIMVYDDNKKQFVLSEDARSENDIYMLSKFLNIVKMPLINKDFTYSYDDTKLAFHRLMTMSVSDCDNFVKKMDIGPHYCEIIFSLAGVMNVCPRPPFKLIVVDENKSGAINFDATRNSTIIPITGLVPNSYSECLFVINMKINPFSSSVKVTLSVRDINTKNIIVTGQTLTDQEWAYIRIDNKANNMVITGNEEVFIIVDNIVPNMNLYIQHATVSFS